MGEEILREIVGMARCGCGALNPPVLCFFIGMKLALLNTELAARAFNYCGV